MKSITLNKIKKLLPILTLLLLTAYSPNSPTPQHNSTSNQASTSAILQLDTKGHTALIKDIVVTNSGDIISASDDKTVRVWDSTTGKEKRKILGEIGSGDAGKIYAIALSSDNRYLAIGGFLAEGHGINDDLVGSIRIYNYQTGKLIKLLKSHTNIVNDLSFSQDGKYLISGSSNFTAKIWEVEHNFRLIDTIRTHSKQVYGVGIFKRVVATMLLLLDMIIEYLSIV